MTDAVYSVVALVVSPSNERILSVSRKTDPDDLGLPGGKVESGEDPADAMFRELFEETGIKAREYVQVYSDRVSARDSRICRAFYVLCWSGQPFTKEAGTVSWVPPVLLLTRSSFADYNDRLFACVLGQFGTHAFFRGSSLPGGSF